MSCSFGGFAAGAGSGLGSDGGGGAAGGAARAGALLKRGRPAADDAVRGRVARAADAPAGGRGAPVRWWRTMGGARLGTVV